MKPKQSKPRVSLSTVVPLAGIAAFACIIYLASTGNLPSGIRALYDFPNGDKVGHVGVMAVVTFALGWLARTKRIDIRITTLFAGTIAATVLITAEEVSQYFISSRTFSLLDLAFSFVGVTCGELALRVVNKWFELSRSQ